MIPGIAKLFTPYRLAILFTTLAIAAAMQVPQLLRVMDSRYQGVLVRINSDEELYLARVQEALAGRPEQTGDAIVGDPVLIGTQMAYFESAEGMLLRFTGWRAPAVEQFMDSVVPPLIFLTLILFFALAGVSRWAAFGGALAFILIQFYSLGRPIHQRDDFFVVFLAFSCIIAGLERRMLWGVLGGMLIGFLVGAYVWAWTFALLWLGLIFLWEVAALIKRRSTANLRRIGRLVLFGAAAVATAVPSLYAWYVMFTHPLYADASFRSGLLHSHLPESWPYTILFTLMAGGTLWTLWCHPQTRRYRYLVATVLTAFIAINQQIVHGAVFYFVVHYLFGLVIAAICVVLFWISVPTHRRSVLTVSLVAAIIYLAAVAYDGRTAIKQFRVSSANFSDQHFATLLSALDAIPRATILSDDDSSLFLAGNTIHDVVYSPYLKNVMMSSEEIAERYCVTALPVAPADRHLENKMLVWPDASNYGRPEAHDREIVLVGKACAAIDKDPAGALKKFHVHYVLWDEKRQPEWDLKRFGVPLTKAVSGSGWSLWSLDTLSAPR